MIHLYQLPQIPYIVKKDSISNVKETIPAEYQKKMTASKKNNVVDMNDDIVCYAPILQEDEFENLFEKDNNVKIDDKDIPPPIRCYAEIMPEFPGGMNSLYNVFGVKISLSRICKKIWYSRYCSCRICCYKNGRNSQC